MRGGTAWPSLAMVKKFFANGLKAVKAHWTKWVHFAHIFWSLTSIFWASKAVFIFSLNCVSFKPPGSPLSSGKSNDPHSVLPCFLTTSSRSLTASKYLDFVLRLSPESTLLSALCALASAVRALRGGLGCSLLSFEQESQMVMLSRLLLAVHGRALPSLRGSHESRLFLVQNGLSPWGCKVWYLVYGRRINGLSTFSS